MGQAKGTHAYFWSPSWRESADYLNKPGFELHAFAMLAGMASPYMTYTSTSGVTLCLLGKSGTAKTGAMYAGLACARTPVDWSGFSRFPFLICEGVSLPKDTIRVTLVS